MPKTIQIRDIDDDVYADLKKRANRRGLSVPEYMRQEATRLSKQLTMDEWFERVNRKPLSNIATQEVLDTMDEWRGPWPEPDAGR